MPMVYIIYIIILKKKKKKTYGEPGRLLFDCDILVCSTPQYVIANIGISWINHRHCCTIGEHFSLVVVWRCWRWPPSWPTCSDRIVYRSGVAWLDSVRICAPLSGGPPSRWSCSSVTHAGSAYRTDSAAQLHLSLLWLQCKDRSSNKQRCY